MPRPLNPLTGKHIKVAVSVRLPIEVVKQLDRIAKHDNRTRSGAVEVAVRKYIAEATARAA